MFIHLPVHYLACFLCVRVKKELLPLVRSLCQDVEFEVRACMCRQLESIARATG